MSSACLWQFIRRSGLVACPLGVLLGLGLLLVGCNNGGNQGRLTPQSGGPPPAMTRQAVDNLLTLYRTALRQADIDRVDALLAPTAPQAPAAATDVQALRAALTATFRTRTVIALEILADTIQVGPDNRSVTFLEVESTEDPATLEQQTHLFRTTWGLTQDAVNGTITIRIGTVQREGPLVQVTIPGQVQAGTLTRVEVQGTGTPFVLTGVEVTVPETGAVQTLVTTDGFWYGVFTPPLQPSPQPLRVQLHGTSGETLVLQHPYRLHVLGEGVVQLVGGTSSTRLFAVTVTPDGTVWAGGDGGATLYQVPPGATRATRVGRLLTHPDGRVEALATDQLGRLHILLIDLADNTVVGHGDIVRDPAFPALLCQTVNIFDAAYPLLDPHSQPSASTRFVAAGGGDVWLFGSDGGVARVQDSFRNGQCPVRGITVRYAPVFRRDTSAVPTSIIPALVAEADGTLWFGTALGLTRLQQGHFTPVPFDRTLTVQGNVATLEAFFQEVAQALFEARPLTTVALEGVSFVEQFGRPLVKEDLIFSAVATAPEQLWVGTLGGGLRHIDGRGVTPQDTRHLTQLDGLPSNLIIALAVGPDGALWVATNKGVSRLREAGGVVTLTTFAALDGLALPVRDVAVDGEGIVWLATDGGLFRVLPHGAQLRGVVHDPSGGPVAGVDVIVQGTPFRAVTDTEGHFVLANLPPGTYSVQFDGHLVAAGPFTITVRDVIVAMGEQTLEPVVLAQVNGLQLVQVSGGGQQAVVGRSLPDPLVVAVLDREGHPIPDIPVTFALTAGDGRLSTTQPVRTDAQGQASTRLTLGTRQGENRVTATAPGLAAVLFTATGLAERASARLIQVSGNNQLAAPGEILPEPLVVRLEDQFRNPLEGEMLTAEIIQGAAEFVASQANLGTTRTEQTDAQGETRFFLRVRPCAEGTVTTEVSAPDIPEVAQVQFLTAVGFPAPFGIAVENNGALAVVDTGLNVVLRVDPHSGARTIVSGAGIGSGPPLGTLVNIALEASGSLVVVYGFAPHTAESSIAPAVARIDPRSGARTIVSGCTEEDAQGACVGEIIGSVGPLLDVPFGIAVEADGSLVVADSGLNAVVRVHPASGDRTIVSDNSVGSGPLFGDLSDIAVAADGSLVVLDGEGGLNAVVRVDPRTGARSIVSAGNTTVGGEPPFIGPHRLAVEADGSLVVADSRLSAVVRVNRVSGRRTVVSGCPRADCPNAEIKGEGPPFVNLIAIAVEADGSLLLGDAGRRAILRVDPSRGDRSIVSEAPPIGDGPSFGIPSRLALEAQGTLVVIDNLLNAVLRVDPVCGTRTIVSGPAAGSGPPFITLADIAVETTGLLVVVHGGGVGSDGVFIPPAVVRIDSRTGARTVVSGGSQNLGGGPPLLNPFALAVQSDASFVIVDRGVNVTDVFIPPAIMRIDPRTGERTVVSGGVAGRGRSALPLLNPSGIAVQADGSLIVVDCGGNCLIPPLLNRSFPPAIVRVNPISGDRTVVLGPPATSGPNLLFSFPAAVAIEEDGSLIVAGGFFFTAALRRVNPENGSHRTVSGMTPLEGIFGHGLPFVAPFGIAVAADNTLIVADFLLGAVVKVDPQTGNRTIISK